MSQAIQQVNKVNAGLCPHGLPPSACPICSNMGGGGGGRVGERPQKAGEMSYHQCAMIGAMMAARKERLENHQELLKAHAEAIQAFQQNMEKMIAKMQTFVNTISNSFIFKPVVFTINNIIIPIFSTAKSIPNIISNLAEKFSQIKQKFIDIQDKLNAIFGEAKAFVDKKISELVSSIKTKFKTLFKITKSENTKDDETKIDEDKKIFNLKTILHKIKSKLKRDDTKN